MNAMNLLDYIDLDHTPWEWALFVAAIVFLLVFRHFAKKHFRRVADELDQRPPDGGE
jgi:hypothetical protein